MDGARHFVARLLEERRDEGRRGVASKNGGEEGLASLYIVMRKRGRGQCGLLEELWPGREAKGWKQASG